MKPSDALRRGMPLARHIGGWFFLMDGRELCACAAGKLLLGYLDAAGQVIEPDNVAQMSDIETRRLLRDLIASGAGIDAIHANLIISNVIEWNDTDHLSDEAIVARLEGLDL